MIPAKRKLMSTDDAHDALALLEANLKSHPANEREDDEETGIVRVEELKQKHEEEEEEVLVLEENEEEEEEEAEEKEKQQQLTPWDRLYEEGLKREARRLEVFEKATADRVARALFDQQCNTAGRSNTQSWNKDFADRQQRWLDTKEERVRRLREEAEIAELRKLQPPAINEASQQMAEKAGYEGPIRGWESHFARYALRFAENSFVPTHMFRPNININAHHSEETVRDIGERLYKEDVQRRQGRLRELMMKYQRSELIDGCTGKPYFTPCISWKTEMARKRRSEQRTRSAARATEMLYIKARERYNKVAEPPVDSNSFTPEICRLSRKMAERRKARSEKRPDVVPKTLTPPEKKSKLKLGEFLSREEACLARRRQKMERVERQLLERQEEECTFIPRINKRSVEIFEGSQQRYGSSSPPMEMTHPGAIQLTPPTEGAETYERDHFISDAISPLLYESSAASTSPLIRIDNDGSRLINEFEHKMKELLNEWRSIERV
ncbi:hypothetical protein C3747_6g673 [Trypanosoma cruzi]|uniref:Uncharacterized protein n=2 Tax=Trypanosoma cruzi TaxID=5693 RepID=Q4DQN0_TRYCC|nr:hypothetical protein Tc00.1047053509109.50 [Trypanosoma cruzi]EAN94822.1 hypothetical protein Tc00.1047053509109.50 [Trypanosoma cruzi]PWV20381.1 hypothetical protein C3747_6g673 [Trypanosoma cruzi]|eukprot:XP_816673.1 hypothetical protein [Trypanosoma cruzi strain CL Brener]